MRSSRVVHVDIHGHRYAIRSELDPSYISELAAFVDEKMRLAANEVQSGESMKVAILAALNIADELFTSRIESGEARWIAKTADIERLVDAVLDLEQPPLAASG